MLICFCIHKMQCSMTVHHEGTHDAGLQVPVRGHYISTNLQHGGDKQLKSKEENHPENAKIVYSAPLCTCFPLTSSLHVGKTVCARLGGELGCCGEAIVHAGVCTCQKHMSVRWLHRAQSSTFTTVLQISRQYKHLGSMLS